VGYPVSLPELDVPRLLRQYNLHPNKSLGQNFLLEAAALQKVVDAARLAPHDIILEIGPGLGSLTRYLALNARQVVAVEIDRQLIPTLKMVVAEFANVTVIEGDILALDTARLVSGSDYLVVANIPYNITSALIRHLLEASRPPCRLVLTVQNEVAQRICAIPGDMSLLALSVQVYGHPEITAKIPASAFYPPPHVDSAIIRIERYPAPLIPVDQLDGFFQLIKAGFSQRRKTLRNALSAGLRLSHISTEDLLKSTGIDPMQRAETLSLPEWRTLTGEYTTRFASR
jgi:16S rRNA (adenine1518-N6/adenine1519-N6)-dimethyltransferase